jgi:hypothetical protein
MPHSQTFPIRSRAPQRAGSHDAQREPVRGERLCETPLTPFHHCQYLSPAALWINCADKVHNPACAFREALI